MNGKNILEKQKQINKKMLLILQTIRIEEIKRNNFVKNKMKQEDKEVGKQ